MVFQSFSIQTASRLKRIQDTINDGIILFHNHRRFGGHLIETSNDDYLSQSLIAKRMLEETEQYTETHKLIGIKRKDIHLENYLNLSQKLQTTATWSALKTRYKSAMITRLERKWMRQAVHAHFTIDALFESDALLNSLFKLTEKAHEEANDTWQTHEGLNIPSYKNYLVSLNELIKKEREAIAEALFYRLKLAFEKHYLTDYNPIRAILNDFQQLGITQFDLMSENKELIRDEKPFPLAKAYTYLMTYGSVDVKAVVSPYFLLKGAITEERIAIQSLKQDDHHYLIPETLLGFIPAKWSFWMWFVPGYRARFTFIHNKSNVLFQLLDAQHSSTPRNGTLDLNHPYWLRLNNLQQQLDGELSQTEQKKYRFFSFLHEKANNLFSRWSKLVLQQQRALIRKQVDYLEVMANNMTSSISLLLEKTNDKYPIDEVAHDSIQLKAQLEHIEKRLEDLLFSDSERRRFQTIKQKIITQWEHGDRPATQDDLDLTLTSKLHRLADNSKTPSLSGFFTLCTDLQTLKTHDESRLQHLAIQQAHYFKIILEHMIKRLAELPEKIKSGHSLSEDQRYFTVTSKLLSFVLPYADDMELSLQALGQQIQAFLDGYPEYIKALAPEQALINQNRLEGINTAIYSVASLNPAWNKEIKTLLGASEFLRDVLARRIPRSFNDIKEESERALKAAEKEHRSTLTLIETSRQARLLRAKNLDLLMQRSTPGEHEEKNHPNKPSDRPDELFTI